jgi:chemotaxis response regulator CheB
MARLLLVSDTEEMTVLLEAAFEGYPVEIVGKAAAVEEATRIAGAAGPEVVVIASGVVLRQDAVRLAEAVYQANPSAVVAVSASTLPDSTKKELLDVCAIPLAVEILELPKALAELVPDLRKG